MNEELLDDDLQPKEANDVGFILTEDATFNLYEAAKWAKISALVIIGLSSFKVISLLYYMYLNKNSISLFEWVSKTSGIVSLLELISTIIVSTFLYSFGDKFLEGYKQDSDDLVDKSLLNLHKFYKFSVLVVAISLSISILFLLINGDLKDVIKYLFFIIPIGLLGFYFYQNRETNAINNQDSSTDNK